MWLRHPDCEQSGYPINYSNDVALAIAFAAAASSSPSAFSVFPRLCQESFVGLLQPLIGGQFRNPNDLDVRPDGSATAFRSTSRVSSVDQDSPHGFGGRSEEMPTRFEG